MSRPCVFEHENCIIVEFTPDGKDGRSVVAKGEWDSETEYIFDDLVSYQGSSYIALKTVPVGTLPTNTEYWMVNASGNTVPWGNIIGTLTDQTDLQDALDLKADASTVYTKTESDALLSTKADASAVYTKTEADTLLSAKADADTVYTKTETDTLLSAKADSSAVYTKTQTDSLLSAKANASAVYTKSETDTLLSTKADTSSLGDLATQDTVDYDTQVTNKPDLGDLASLDSISYESNYLTDKPTLGTMSAVNDAPSDNKQYARKNGEWAEVQGGSGGGSWGSITGTLSDQTDLQQALDSKADIIKAQASGSVVSITDGAPYAVDALTVGIEPVQSGSGDPSPDNVRPISGHSSSTVTRTGRNLIGLTGRRIITSNPLSNATPRDFSEPSVYIGISASNYFNNQKCNEYTITESSVTVTSIEAGYGVGFTISVKPSTQYVFNYKNKALSYAAVAYYDSDGNFLSFRNFNTLESFSFLTPSNCTNIILVLKSKENNETATYEEPQLELGSTATAYETPNIQQVTISLGQTVYGATLDVKNGAMTVTNANIPSYNGEILPSTWISDRDVYSAGATPTTGAQVVYKLATPIEVTLIPETLSTLLGNNVLWASTGNIENVTYRADTKLYIDRKVAEANTTTRAMIADSATADGKAPKSLASGDLIIVGDKLRKCTSNIGSGSAITNSNSTTATLADVIKALQ